MKHKPDEKEKNNFSHKNCKVRNHPLEITKHHQPAKVPDTTPRPQILLKQRRHHEAFHLLFGNPANYTSACFILKRDWFPDNFDEDKFNGFKPPDL